MSAHTPWPWESSRHWNPHGGTVIRLENGRYAQLGKPVRVRRDPRRSFSDWINKVTVRYLDDGSTEFASLAQFNMRVRKARAILRDVEGERNG